MGGTTAVSGHTTNFVSGCCFKAISVSVLSEWISSRYAETPPFQGSVLFCTQRISIRAPASFLAHCTMPYTDDTTSKPSITPSESFCLFTTFKTIVPTFLLTFIVCSFSIWCHSSAAHSKQSARTAEHDTQIKDTIHTPPNEAH